MTNGIASIRRAIYYSYGIRGTLPDTGTWSTGTLDSSMSNATFEYMQNGCTTATRYQVVQLFIFALTP
jgi:hypothetical protein